MAISPSNKTNFIKWGQWMCYDNTYNLFKDRNSLNQTYKLGFFTGLSNNNKIVPFGFAIMCK